MIRFQTFVRASIIAILLASSPVFASNAPTVAEPAPVFDPFEGINRIFFGLNEVVDILIVTPTVTVWNTIIPSPVRDGVSNVFNNLDDVYAGLNHALQGNGTQAAVDFQRVAVNTTIGLGGIFDVGTKMGLQKVYGDFGQTLGVWGASPGPYLVVPLLGPSNLRETVGRGIRIVSDPRTYADPGLSNGLMALELVDNRASTAANEQLISSSSFDKYAFTRSLYMQRRAALVEAGGSRH